MKRFIPLLLATSYLFCGCGSPAETTTTTEVTTVAKATTEVTTETKEINTEIAAQNQETTTVETVTKSNPILSNLKERDIKSGDGSTFIGKYLIAEIPENSFTDSDLIEFYNYCKENKESYYYMIIDFGTGEGLWYDFQLSRKELEFDTEVGSGYIQHKTLGYYSVNGNKITYEPAK